VIICCFASSLLLAWKLMQPFNFGYAFWYQQLGIEAHIERFAPQNRQGKTGFETTDYDTRYQLFAGISEAVNNGGDGLRTLSYNTPDGAEQLLLTDPEAVHLEDVAKLIDLLVPIGWAALALLLVLAVVSLLARMPMPGIGKSLLTLVVIAIICAIVIVAVGPHEVFKAMHEMVFPDDHQWFFYYQDSLMTTLMKAPDIFFAIGAAWALLASIIYLALTLLLRALSPT
jgi:hypothetical protein